MAKKDLSEWLTTVAAAELMGCHRRHVLALVASGKLESVRVGYSHLIRKASARAWVRDAAGRGRPKAKGRKSK
jgi:excisionase family DNA binding protein